MSFQVIAGSGHCGTMWLAHVLNSVPGQRWFHELRTEMSGLPWQEASRYSVPHRCFHSYWTLVGKMLEAHDVVGDSNSWEPEALPDVNRVQPIERVIYLTRDKDKQLHSILNHSPVWSQPANHWPEVARQRIAHYARISGKAASVRLLVDASDFMPDWLREHGLQVDVYSLEELTTNIGKLRELAPLTDAELQAWQKRDINRKVAA